MLSITFGGKNGKNIISVVTVSGEPIIEYWLDDTQKIHNQNLFSNGCGAIINDGDRIQIILESDSQLLTTSLPTNELNRGCNPAITALEKINEDKFLLWYHDNESFGALILEVDKKSKQLFTHLGIYKKFSDPKLKADVPYLSVEDFENISEDIEPREQDLKTLNRVRGLIPTDRIDNFQRFTNQPKYPLRRINFVN